MQLAVWERADPLPKVHLVHSKLQTLHWPNTDNVLRKVALLLPCSQLAVTVKVMDYHDGVGLEVAAPDKLVRAAASLKRLVVGFFLESGAWRVSGFDWRPGTRAWAAAVR